MCSYGTCLSHQVLGCGWQLEIIEMPQYNFIGVVLSGRGRLGRSPHPSCGDSLDRGIYDCGNLGNLSRLRLLGFYFLGIANILYYSNYYLRQI